MEIIIAFSEDVAVTKYCQIVLDKANYNALAYAVKNHYWYQMYVGMWIEDAFFIIAIVFVMLNCFVDNCTSLLFLDIHSRRGSTSRFIRGEILCFSRML